MAVLMSQQKVKDYAAWESVFMERDGQRQALGQKSFRILREADDANSLVVLMDWDTMENARNYASSPGLKEAMANAGVIGAEINYLEDASGNDTG